MLFMPIWAAAISAPRASLRSVALRNVPAGTEPRLLFLLAKEEKEAKRRMTKDFNNTANLIGKSAWFGRSPEICTSIRPAILWMPEEAGVLDL